MSVRCDKLLLCLEYEGWVLLTSELNQKRSFFPTEQNKIIEITSNPPQMKKNSPEMCPEKVTETVLLYFCSYMSVYMMQGEEKTEAKRNTLRKADQERVKTTLHFLVSELKVSYKTRRSK